MTYEAVQSESYVNNSNFKEAHGNNTSPESYINYPAQRENRPESYVNPQQLRCSATQYPTRPESYVDPSVFVNSCAEDENYESLTDIQTKVNSNLYEVPPALKVVQPSPKTQINEDKDCTNCHFDKTEIIKIQNDLRKTNIFLMIFGLLLLVFLLISITAVVLAVILSSPNTKEENVILSTPEAQVGQGRAPEQLNNSGQINMLYSELSRVNETLKFSTQELNSALSELANLTQQNLSNFVAELNTVKDSLDFYMSQLQNQLSMAQRNMTLLNERITYLQNQLLATQNMIDELENRVTGVYVTQSDIQTRYNMTQSNLTQINNQLRTLQEQVSTVDTDSVSDAVARIQTRLSAVETNYNAINLHFSNVQTQLNTTQTSVSLVSSQLNSFQTLINNRLNNQVNLYQNCRQDRATCLISILTNDNRRVFCSTDTLSRNITVRYSPACLVHIYK